MKLIITAIIALVAANAMAETDAAYYQIANIKTELVRTEDVNSREVMDLLPGSCNAQKANVKVQDLGLSDVGVILDQVINLGKKVWDIVQAGKPVTNLQFDVATALPQGTQCWTQLENWKQPVSQVFRVSATNTYGFNVVTFDYRVLYVYGGSYNGQGNYIGYATTQPANVSVSWGFNLDAKSSVPVVMNAGSKESPVGAMQMNMDYTINTVMNNTRQSQSYYITGLGDLKAMGN